MKELFNRYWESVGASWADWIESGEVFRTCGTCGRVAVVGWDGLQAEYGLTADPAKALLGIEETAPPDPCAHCDGTRFTYAPVHTHANRP